MAISLSECRIPPLEPFRDSIFSVTAFACNLPPEYEGRSAIQNVANSQVLPAYTKVDIDAQVKVTNEISIFGIIDNLTNSLGLTEGNPRQGEIKSAEANQFYFLARPILGRSLKFLLGISFNSPQGAFSQKAGICKKRRGCIKSN